ncbi:F1 ATPase assembly protein 11 [Coprinopsis marcescibilis]|uniref:F1 ATPase assembly protein 11 n=1 Tax=Coprinopsis marcescibilis TaxID=230819 RepID=A0A5C3LDJ4_COPMA|nr:F1 ATPase assembly protein 11 [Coprinopsis marcescibilis]
MFRTAITTLRTGTSTHLPSVGRSLHSTAVCQKTVKEKVANAAEEVNLKLGKGVAAAIEKGEQVTEATKKTLGATTEQAKRNTEEVTEVGKQKMNQTDVDAKYKEKILQKAKESGVSLDELKLRAKDVIKERADADRKALEATLTSQAQKELQGQTSSQELKEPFSSAPAFTKERKDGSPVKPLSTFFNVEKLFLTPHSAEKIASLWNIYHASRSGGTGRGFVCASLPSTLYSKLEVNGQRYPSFVVPVPRPRPADAGPIQEGESDTAYEFFFMQWLFHERPPVPKSDNSNPFDVPTSKNSTNPPLATVLFTPLQEYKLRQSFATPYLIVTFYTDLVTTHQQVLMRGEITPATATSSGSDRYMLSQVDAQFLVMQLQKFYLWTRGENGGSETDAVKLLRTFHEKPEEFKWEDLMKMGNLNL